MPNDNILQGLNVGTDVISGLMQGGSGGNFSGAGKAIGSALGSAIPIPVVGTMLGGALGGIIGGAIKTPEQKKAEALQDNAIGKMNLIAQQRRDNAMQNDLIAQNTIFQSF